MGDRNGLTGRCECGAVRYRVDGPTSPVIACHCGQCRRIHGHYAAYCDARRDDLTIDGADGLSWYDSSDFARRGFCRTCGSSLFWDRHGGEHVGVAAGTIDRPTGLKTVAHIFCDDASDYYAIDPDTETYPQGYGDARPGGRP